MDNISFKDIQPVSNRQQIKFKCTACGACCKNVRDSIVLEPLDAFRIVREYLKNGYAGSADELLDEITDLKELSRGFYVFVLKPVNDSGVCSMLKDNRCTIYPVRPHTCRLYPFTADPCEKERRIRWYLCTEQPHHFKNGVVTPREWQRRNISHEDEEYLYEECRVLPELGKLMRNISEADLQEVEQYTLLFRYLAYDYTQPFFPQYKDNMLFLKARLNRLQQE